MNELAAIVAFCNTPKVHGACEICGADTWHGGKLPDRDCSFICKKCFSAAWQPIHDAEREAKRAKSLAWFDAMSDAEFIEAYGDWSDRAETRNYIATCN